MTFEYRDPGAFHERPGTQIGMVAQEVEGSFPSWVDVGSDGYRRLTFRGFKALTVEAMRELRAEVNATAAALRSDLAELAAENARLRSEIEQLKAIQPPGRQD